MERSSEVWADFGEALAFVGNSLLSPMNQTGTVGLDPAFWARFPALALARLQAYAEAAQASAAEGGNPATEASVDYTKLFVGPPSPAAAPWETLHRGEGATFGFGEPTFDMQRLLREAGLQVSNENNQYADHIGIELLYASVLCSHIAEAIGAGHAEKQTDLEDKLAEFLPAHPLGWIDRLRAAVGEVSPAGYIACLLDLAKALLIALG